MTSLAQAAKMSEMQAEIAALWAAVTELRAREIDATAEKRRPMLKLAKDRPDENGRQPDSRGD